MVALLDSDDDDISSTVRRKNVKKHFRKKIDDDSDSSSDENKGESSKDDQSIVLLNKISDGDVISGDNLNSDESSKGQISSGAAEIGRVQAKGDWSNDNLMVGEINGSSDDDLLGKDCKNYKQNESMHEGMANKNKKLKERIYCFDDNESSDEETYDKLKTLGDTRNEDLLSRTEEEYSSYKNKTGDALIQEDNDNKNVNGPYDTDTLEADDVDNILKNKEIFDADSESDNEVNSRVINDDDIQDNEDDELVNTQPGTKKERRPGKDAQKEAKSEQQRLLREQKFKLPYHVPEVKPLKDFLLRVPVLKTKGWKRQLPAEEREISNGGPLDNIDDDKDEIREITSSENVIVNVNDGAIPSKSENETSGSNKVNSKIENLFKQKPKLSFGGEEIIEFDNIEDTDVCSVKGLPKKNMSELDSFMRRFEKHTKSKGIKQIEKQNANSKSSSISSVIIPDKEIVPGGRRIAFAEHMKLKIRKERSDALKELERERKLYNEEDTSEEDEFNGDDEDETEEVEGIKIVDDDGNSSNDEELEKWNVEDRRKALEIEMTEEENLKKTVNVNANSVDFSIEGQKTHSDQSEKDDIHWDDTSSTVSSFLPAGQGDPTGCKNNVEGRMTPFSKLMKSGLLDSTSNLNYSNNSNSIGLTGGIALPCEDTQDLYKENFEKKEEESQMVLNNLELNLEETQYTQVIDSQGFFNESKKSKRQLFDDDGKDVNTFSQVLDLCSGKFDDADNEKKADVGVNRFFEKDEFSMIQVVGLCSGKFTGDDGDDDDAISSTRLDCADGSLSNPPVEHPFFSRINDTDKLSKKESSFSDTPENIFKMHTAGKKSEDLDMPLGLSNIIDDNFDDNAMDFCTAPFSGNVREKGGEDVEESSSGKNGVLSQTKFDVGNWLNEGKKLNGENSERRSDRSMNEIGKQKLIKEKHDDDNEDDDNEDDVFADNEDESVCSDEEDEITGGDNTEGVVAEGDDEEESEDEYDENELNAELLEYQNAVSAKDKNKWSKSAFAEKEAELSGSDINSDAEELGSEYDEYEIDSDVEDLPSGEKLKSQVHKIHQKKLLDQDQREVRLLQELYIEDADRAYGKKRQRNFRWRNVADDDGSYNLTGHSDEEIDELNLDNSISQKLERAEREKYISELEEREKVSMDENSQTILEMIKDPTKVISEKPVPTAQSRKSSKSDMRHLSQKRTGSFMSQTKSSVSHLISTVKVGGQGGKSFVFQTAGEGDLKTEDKENKVVIRKTPMSEPVKKRAKFNVESSESQSIFDLL